jgi:phage-related baseplate assembly protein
VSVLARAGDGAAPQALLDAVRAKLASDDVRPMTDFVTVQSAEIVEYEVEATVYTFAGPDSTVVLTEANANLQRYVDELHRMGRDVTLSGIYASLHVGGVQRVVLTAPLVDVVISRTQASHCTAISLNYGGLGE